MAWRDDGINTFAGEISALKKKVKKDLRYYSKDVQARLVRILKYAIEKYDKVEEDSYEFVVDYPNRWKGPDLISPLAIVKALRERNSDSDAVAGQSKNATLKELRYVAVAVYLIQGVGLWQAGQI